jgi:antitoxin PrlF
MGVEVDTMHQPLTVVTRKGQITIPADIRRKLGIKVGDKIALTVEEDRMSLTPATFTLESAYGSVEPTQRPEDFAEITCQAKEEKVARVMRQL